MLTTAEAEIILLSLKVALASVAATLPVALLLAHVLERKTFHGKALVDALLHVPLVLPPVVVGYALLVLFSERGPLGAWLLNTFGISFAFNWKGAALAAAVMGLPLFVRAVRQGLQAVDPQLEAQAQSLGASPWRAWLTITLPLMMPGVIAGAVLAFARSLGEFGATITFVGSIPGETQTLPLAIYAALQTVDGEAIATRLCIVSLVIALAALAISEWMYRRIQAARA